MVEKNSKGFITLLLVGLVFLVAFLLVGGSNLFNDVITPISDQTYQVDTNSSSSQVDKSLQLRTIGFNALPSNTPAPGTPTNTPTPGPGPIRWPTPTPGPGGFCGIHGSRTAVCRCQGDEITVLACYNSSICPNPNPETLATCDVYSGCQVQYFASPSTDDPRRILDSSNILLIEPGRRASCWISITRLGSDAEYQQRKQTSSNCHEVCIGKPVIYLYPEKTMMVDVSVETAGSIFVSDPLYPEGGWRDVKAYPDGMLFYQGEKYRELFYESSVSSVQQPKSGVFIPREQLQEKLGEYITRLGLIGSEHIEFMEYWLPRLLELNKPYIFFSIVEKEEKERIDKVRITPQPDTFIEFIAYFKGVDTLFPIVPLVLPQKPQDRKGFTAVEWGGTIDFERNKRLTMLE